MTEPVLFHCPQTRAGTTMWMNEELGAPCALEIVDIRAGAHKEPAFLARNPMGKVPALLDANVVVTESAAICAHLADKYPDAGLAPPIGSPNRGAYYRWMFFAPSVLEPMMLDKLGGVERENPGSAGHGRPEDVLAAVRGALDGGEYVVGDAFTAADLVLASALRFAMMFGAISKEEPFASYVERVTKRPAAERAAKKDAELAKGLGWT
ncbi:MAG: glutathione S-transferase family protein [Pseudomonadota bacterium]